MASSAPVTANEFLELVRKSGVLDAEQFAEQFPDIESLPQEARACANALIKAGLLTPYQCDQLLAGRFRGFRLGAYKILQPLGKGGMGTVYLGEHADLKRRVAVKVLATNKVGDKLAVERFYREGRAAAALDHPNIVRLYDISQGSTVHYLTMEYVEGNDLETLTSRLGQIHYAQAVHYVAQAAAGLQHAHSKGFVHRDIKPANLMLSKDGTVKILDMGLARSFDGASDNLTGQLGEKGEAVGTADYVSPEQALGQPVDERGDIYSLGATLFALITGHPPFSGNLAQLLVKHQMAPPPPLPRNLKVPAPEGLNDVIGRMMAKDPDDRYQTAAEVIDALSPWLDDPSLSSPLRNTVEMRAAHTPTQTSRTRLKRAAKKVAAERARRKKRQTIAAAVGGGVLLLVIVIAVLSFGRDKPPTSETKPDGGTPTPPRVVEQPRPVVPEVSQRLATTAGQVQDIAYSADGSKFAVVDWSGNVTLWEANPPKQIRSIPAGRSSSRFNCCTITRDGRYLVVGGNQVPLLVCDWETGEKVHEYPGHTETTWGVAVSPDGESILSCGNDGRVVLRKLATGEEIRHFDMEAKQVWCVAFSADGKKMAAGCGKGSTTADSHFIRVWDTASGQELHRLAGHTLDVRWVTFRPDGAVLASASFDGSIRQWSLTDGTDAGTIAAHTGGYVERVHYLANGTRLLTCGGPMNATAHGMEAALKLWDATTGQEIRAWKGDEATGLISLAVAPDGSIALTGSRNKALRLWKLPR